jgi:protein-tyrosine-phosphatase
MSGRPPAVLFVCGRNSIRSPMAERLTAHLFPGRFYVSSAGIVPGERDAFVDAILSELGIGPVEHGPRALDDLEDLSFDLAITLSPEAHHRVLELTRTHAIEVEYWPTFDPTAVLGSREHVLAAYRELRELLATRIRERFGGLDSGRASSH